MDEFTFIATAVMVGVPLLFGVILAIILLAGRPRPQTGLGAQFDGTTLPAGRWNAQVLSNSAAGRLGGSLGALTGRFEVSDAELRFFTCEEHSDDTPLWRLPCRDLTARAHGMMSTAGVELWSPHGHLRCNVSREHINAFFANTLKSMREPRYAREFVDVLVAHGARRA